MSESLQREAAKKQAMKQVRWKSELDAFGGVSISAHIFKYQFCYLGVETKQSRCV